MKIDYAVISKAWDDYKPIGRRGGKSFWLAIKTAIEKQIPKEPIVLDRRCENGDEVCIEWKCPVCGLGVIEEPPCQEYCQRCGNKLNWN